MDIEECVKNPLWSILVETVHTIVMFPYHKFYVQSVFITEKPDVSPQDLSLNLGISLGEAIVILYELKMEKKQM